MNGKRRTDMKFIPYEVNTGSKNMQIDNKLLDFAIEKELKEPILRLYGWSPACVSLGRNQKDDFIDYALLHKKNIDAIRRLTGGRALLHDDEITYSYITPTSLLPHGDNVDGSYKDISQILIDRFAKLGIELEFGGIKKSSHNIDYCMLVATGADLCYKGKKLIGSAQFRKNGYILQHGSILYDYNKELLKEIFKEDINTDAITTIKEINPEISREDIINLLTPLNIS